MQRSEFSDDLFTYTSYKTDIMCKYICTGPQTFIFTFNNIGPESEALVLSSDLDAQDHFNITIINPFIKRRTSQSITLLLYHILSKITTKTIDLTIQIFTEDIEDLIDCFIIIMKDLKIADLKYSKEDKSILFNEIVIYRSL